MKIAYIIIFTKTSKIVQELPKVLAALSNAHLACAGQEQCGPFQFGLRARCPWNVTSAIEVFFKLFTPSHWPYNIQSDTDMDNATKELHRGMVNTIAQISQLFAPLLNHDKPSPPRLNTQHETGNGTHCRNAWSNIVAEMIAIIVKHNLRLTPSYTYNLQKLLHYLQYATLCSKCITSAVSLV